MTISITPMSAQVKLQVPDPAGDRYNIGYGFLRAYPDYYGDLFPGEYLDRNMDADTGYIQYRGLTNIDALDQAFLMVANTPAPSSGGEYNYGELDLDIYDPAILVPAEVTTVNRSFKITLSCINGDGVELLIELVYPLYGGVVGAPCYWDWRALNFGADPETSPYYEPTVPPVGKHIIRFPLAALSNAILPGATVVSITVRPPLLCFTYPLVEPAMQRWRLNSLRLYNDTSGF